MSRHRRDRHLFEYEIREVSNALAPAVAHREDTGKVVVDVDEKLHGRERSDAINAALESFRRGERTALPAGLIGVMMDASARAFREHQRAAAALAGATATAAIGVVTLAATGVLERAEQSPPAVAATIIRTVTSPAPATAAPAVSEPSAKPERTRGREPEPGRTLLPPARAEAADDEPPVRQPAAATPDRPQPEPVRSTKRPARTPTAKPTSKVPAVQAARAETPPRETRRGSPAEEPAPPTVDEPDIEPTPAPQPQPEPEPTPAAAGCGGIGLGIDLDPLLGLDLCLLD